MVQNRWLIVKAFFIMIALLVIAIGGFALYYFSSFVDSFAGQMEAMHQ